MQSATKIDVIILSNSRTNELRQVTEQCIASLLASEDKNTVFFEVLVIESEKQAAPYAHPQTRTLYPGIAFGYNKFMNIGIAATCHPYVCLCNNDLLFHNHWATEILEALKSKKHIRSANPYSPVFHYDPKIEAGPNVMIRSENSGIDGILTGWCIFAERGVFTEIGPLDERFVFWYADNDYGLTLDQHGIRHALVKSSLVTHLEAQSHGLLSERREEFTTGQRVLFDQKWNTPKWRVYKRLVKSWIRAAIERMS